MGNVHYSILEEGMSSTVLEMLIYLQLRIENIF